MMEYHMKRAILLIMTLVAVGLSGAQTIDGPVATVKLTKQDVISRKQFNADIAKIEKLRGKTLTDAERKAFLDDAVNDILFFQMCERDKILVSDGEVNTQIAQMKGQLGPQATDEQFEAALTAQGVQLADLRTYVKKQLLVQRFIQQKRADEVKAFKPVGADDILDYYELNKSKLVQPDIARTAFLVYQFKDQTSDEKKKAAALMKPVAQTLSSNSAKFDEYRLRSKELGFSASQDVYFERSELYMQQFGKQIYDAVFGLQDGKTSEIIENEKGLWIIKRYSFTPQKQLELGDAIKPGVQGTVQQYIQYQLEQQRTQEFLKKIFDGLLAELRKQAVVNIVDAKLRP